LTITSNKGTSVTLRNFITEQTKGDSAFTAICTDFKNIQTDASYRRNELPESRKQFRSLTDLLVIALVNVENWDDFKFRATGILPVNDLQKLVSLLQNAESYYDRLIWNKYQDKLTETLVALKAYTDKAAAIFSFFNHFYRTGWTDDMPFTVALYPVPGASGHTTATPHVNSLCVGVLTEGKNTAGRMGVVLHEICHVLYDEQPKEVQHELENFFSNNNSAFASAAHNYFDEALATALGNGWAYKSLADSLNPRDWYADKYINGFGKSLYPLVAGYINNNKQIDRPFIDSAIALFGQKFPNSLSDYGILLNNVSIYSDGEDQEERNQLVGTLRDHFQLSSVYLSSPIRDEKSLALLRNSGQTQLVIIDRNNEAVFTALKKLFPLLTKEKAADTRHPFILCFFDDRKRAIIILNVPEKDDLRKLVKSMKEKQFFSTTTILQQTGR
jgi:hypothetical protein